jgi:hypothetical protein
MIMDSGQARNIREFKGIAFEQMDLDTRVEFAKAQGFPEPGVTVEELLAIQKGLDLLGKRPITILETGMCYGTTTRFFLTWLLQNGGNLHTVEFRIRTQFAVEMDYLGLWKDPHFHVHEEDSRKMYWDSKDGIDFLFIDSEHALSDALGEYMRFRVFLNHNALIGFHDSQCCYGVKRAIEFINEVDVLEEVAANKSPSDAGIIVYKLISRDRNDPNYKVEV